MRYNLASDSANNRIGYKSTAFDAALKDALAASTDDQKRAAYKKLAEIYTTDVPSLIYEALPDYITWRPNVHGVLGTQNLLVYFDKAWIEK